MAQFAHRTAGGHSPDEKRRNIRDYRRALRSGQVHLATKPFIQALQAIHAVIEGREGLTPFRTCPVATRSAREGSPIYPIGLPWQAVPRALNDIESTLLSAHRIETVSGAFLVHYELLRAHPFNDANGRLARVVLTLMLADVIGSPIFIDLTRPMRGSFLVYNGLLREPRGGDSYRRWVNLFFGFLRAEIHQVERLRSAIDRLPPRLHFRLTRLVDRALTEIDEKERADETLAYALTTEDEPIRSFIKALVG
jgi:Fic family protein